MLKWTRDQILAEVERRLGAGAAEPWLKIERWATSHRSLAVRLGGAETDGSINIIHRRSDLPILKLWTYGAIELQFEYLKTKPPFKKLDERKKYRERLSSLVSITDRQVATRPHVALKVLEDPSRLKSFLDAHEWLIKRLDMSWPDWS